MHAPLVELTLEAEAFARDWNHCDQVANYLALLVAHDRPDSFLYANLLSTVLNELLESAFTRQSGCGSVHCKLLRADQSDRFELTLPAGPGARSFYQSTVAAARSTTAPEAYTQALRGKDSPPDLVGILELAADYGARFSLEQPESADEIRLVLEVNLAPETAS